ncbi:MAG: hypothetical protein BWY91_01385 [bacterium ADurb.BinA028]|nr:MAG: hypothetical protein BWY91_01385 [bacterium ADurb.BinA028]
MRTSEVALPAVAAIEPSTAAAARATPVATRPRTSDERAPKATRARMSRPMASVPNGWPGPGGSTGVPLASGSTPSNGANTAMAATRAMTPRAILDVIGNDWMAGSRKPGRLSSDLVRVGRSIRCS